MKVRKTDALTCEACGEWIPVEKGTDPEHTVLTHLDEQHGQRFEPAAAYVCGECESLYEDCDEAKECCK